MWEKTRLKTFGIAARVSWTECVFVFVLYEIFVSPFVCWLYLLRSGYFMLLCFVLFSFLARWCRSGCGRLCFSFFFWDSSTLHIEPKQSTSRIFTCQWCEYFCVCTVYVMEVLASHNIDFIHRFHDNFLFATKQKCAKWHARNHNHKSEYTRALLFLFFSECAVNFGLVGGAKHKHVSKVSVAFILFYFLLADAYVYCF